MKGPAYYRKMANLMAGFFILLCLGGIVGIAYYVGYTDGVSAVCLT